MNCMKDNICVVGYKLLTPADKCRPSDRKADDYWRLLLKEFGLQGAVHFETVEDFRGKAGTSQSLVLVTFSDEEARQIKEIKPGVIIYVVSHPRSLFRKKSEFGAKEKELRLTLTEIKKLVKEIKKADPKERKRIEKIASMTFDQMYEMIQVGLISDDPKIVDLSWRMLNSGQGEMLWIRAKLLIDVWQKGDANFLQQFLVMAMEQHVDNGFATVLDNFVDGDGVEYKQYQLHLPDGRDLKHIRVSR